MRRQVQRLAGLCIFVILSIYLYSHWDEFGEIYEINPIALAAMYLITLTGSIVGAAVSRTMLNAIGARARFLNMLILQNAIYIFSYLPLKAGIVIRADYLKQQYGVTYRAFGFLIFHLSLLSTAIASLTGMCVLAIAHGLDAPAARYACTTFMLIFLAMTAVLFLPVKLFNVSGYSASLADKVKRSRAELSGNQQAISVCVGLLSLNFLLGAARLGIIYEELGTKVNVADMLVLAALGQVAVALSITPGALGIREAMVGAGAMAIGQELETGVLVALIDRSIALSWSFIIGGPCATWLWTRYSRVSRTNKSME